MGEAPDVLVPGHTRHDSERGKTPTLINRRGGKGLKQN